MSEEIQWVGVCRLALIIVLGLGVVVGGAVSCQGLSEKGATERTRITGKRYAPQIEAGLGSKKRRETPVESKP